MLDESMELDAEIIVVGGNVAGASIARELVLRGIDVLLVEIRKMDKIGYGNFGDALAYHQFNSVGVEIPKGDFIVRDLDNITIFSPDEDASITFNNVGKSMNRYLFNQHLIDEARSAGVRILAETMALAPIVEKGGVCGLKVREKAGTRIRHLRCFALVDASGVKGHIRRKLPPSWPISEKALPDETATCYVEVRRKPPADLSGGVREKPFLKGYFSQKLAPGGLHWFTSDCHGQDTYTLGVGVRNTRGRTNPRSIFYNKLLPRFPSLAGKDIVQKGGGLVSTRVPLSSMVGNGILAVGDAAYQTSPLTGCGIATAIFAGKIGAEVLEKCVKSGDISTAALWDYNVRYYETYGFKQAMLQVLSDGLRDIGDAALKELVNTNLIDPEELAQAINDGTGELSLFQKLKVGLNLITHPGLILKFRSMLFKARRARKHFQAYPSTKAGLEKWRARSKKIMRK